MLYAEGLLPGMPDIFVAVANKGFNGLWMELKTHKGKVSDKQKIIRERLTAAGYLVYMARDKDNAITLIEDYINNK